MKVSIATTRSPGRPEARFLVLDFGRRMAQFWSIPYDVAGARRRYGLRSPARVLPLLRAEATTTLGR